MNELRFAELRAAGERRLTGTAVRYGDEAALPWGRERIQPGAFAPLGDVLLNRQHRREAPLARTGGGGLVLEDTPEALRMTAELPATRDAADVMELVRGGVMRGISVEFRALSDRMQSGVRIIERAKLLALAVVDVPAYPEALVQARTAALGLPLRPLVRRIVW